MDGCRSRPPPGPKLYLSIWRARQTDAIAEQTSSNRSRGEESDGQTSLRAAPSLTLDFVMQLLLE